MSLAARLAPHGLLDVANGVASTFGVDLELVATHAPAATKLEVEMVARGWHPIGAARVIGANSGGACNRTPQARGRTRTEASQGASAPAPAPRRGGATAAALAPPPKDDDARFWARQRAMRVCLDAVLQSDRPTGSAPRGGRERVMPYCTDRYEPVPTSPRSGPWRVVWRASKRPYLDVGFASLDEARYALVDLLSPYPADSEWRTQLGTAEVG